ncbi:MAG: tetratricopeptide repeat protein [Candidatus Eisenbacteria bacterium]|nr:tetratricopeptide repeat protein [Candidatus Eisenbacteria bacterium]
MLLPRSVGGTGTDGRSHDPALAEIEQILENGQFEQGESAARAELARLRATAVSDSLRYVPLFDFVVDAMRSRNKLQSGEARRLAERSLAIREAHLGPDDPSIATSLSGLGRVLTAMQRLDEAEPILERALAIRRRSFRPTIR